MTKKDSRMEWILLLEENIKTFDKKSYFTDYEICSEVYIPGVPEEYIDNTLLFGLYSLEKDINGLYSYTIRVRHSQKEFTFDKERYSKEGYFFKDGLIGELIAIFSFYFQARFYLKSTISGELTPKSLRWRSDKCFRYIKPRKNAHFEMFSEQNRNWADKNLKLFLKNIQSIDQKYHQSLISAFHWYSKAIKEIGVDHELFYIKMVSCIESLLEFIELPKDNLNKKLKEFIKNTTNTEKQEMNNWLKTRKIQQKFIYFVDKYSSGFFKKGYRKAKHCYIKRADLKNFLKRIYTARSKYLHNGKPMYISIDMNIGADSSDNKCHLWDIYPGSDMFIDRKLIKGNEKLPRARWFERIVNHCLRQFIKEIK